MSGAGIGAVGAQRAGGVQRGAGPQDPRHHHRLVRLPGRSRGGGRHRGQACHAGPGPPPGGGAGGRAGRFR
eukprot:180801-Prorocentrum_minimum.AAC.1